MHTAPTNEPRWQHWVERICASWRSTVGGIIRTGALLNEAKAELHHGEFLDMLKETPFEPRMAQMLMSIASHPVLSNTNHGSHLPTNWTTLRELAKVPARLLEAKIADGTVHPRMQRSEVQKLLPHRAAKQAEPRITEKQKREELEGEIADLKADLASAQNDDSGPFNLVDDEVEFIADSIIGIAGDDKAQAIAAAILERFKKPSAKPKSRKKKANDNLTEH